MGKATILIIGDELLHGEIVDKNGPWLIQELNDLGVDVKKLAIIPDDPDVIVDHIKAESDTDYVLITGGIGPTHDDRTKNAVARATNRDLVEHPLILDHLKDNHGSDLSESRRRLASLPEDSELKHNDGALGISFRVDNVYVFPGIPELLQSLFPCWKSDFDGNKKLTESLTVHGWESDIAEELTRIKENYDTVQFGSYPHNDGTLTIKIRGRDSEQVTDAFETVKETFDNEADFF